MLRAIERATRQPIEEMELPSVEAVNDKRVAKFLGRITDALAASRASELDLFRDLVERYEREHNVPAVEIAAALAKMVQGKTPLLLAPDASREPRARSVAERPTRGRSAASAPRSSGVRARANVRSARRARARARTSARAARRIRAWRPTASKSATTTA